jgi:SAM-dependent methyltransferase
LPAARFHVVLVVPDAQPSAQGAREAAETLLHGLRHSGREATLAVNGIDRGAVNIVLNPHLLAVQSLPPETILYNFEPVHGESELVKLRYVDLVRRHLTWDLSRRSVEAWRRLVPGVRVSYVPLGHAPEMTRIAAATEDIDVLFEGVMSERVERILKALESRGVRVANGYGNFGPARDALVARAKLVLSVHHRDGTIVEMPRVAYLLSNRKAVVAEVDADTDIEDDLRDAVAGAPLGGVVERCAALLADEAARRALAERGHAAFARRSQTQIVDAALRADPAPPAADPAPVPRRLNAGSGKGWRIDCLNVDIDPLWRPDLAADLGKPLAAGEVVDLGRFGRRELPFDYFDEIHASHLLEHIPDLVTAMSTFLALLREGGRLHAEVPYDLSYGAWQDPTHVRAMNERSWLYYTDWFWYLGWQEHRFEVVELQYLLSDIGRKLSAAGTPFEGFVRIPRAVDAMRVVLRKVRLTDEERARGTDRWA